MKFFGGVGHRPRNNRLAFGSNLYQDPDAGIL